MYEWIGTDDETVYNNDEYVDYMEQTKRIVKMKKGLTTLYVNWSKSKAWCKKFNNQQKDTKFNENDRNWSEFERECVTT